MTPLNCLFTEILIYKVFSLQLDMMDISNLLNYLHHVQSQTNEKYEPVTGDGLTERQLFKCLKNP